MRGLWQGSLTLLALAALTGYWLWASVGSASADGGGLLGGVLSQDDPPAEETQDDTGLLESVTAPNGVLDTAVGAVGAVAGNGDEKPSTQEAPKEKGTPEEPAKEPGLIESAVSMVSDAASSDSSKASPNLTQDLTTAPSGALEKATNATDDVVSSEPTENVVGLLSSSSDTTSGLLDGATDVTDKVIGSGTAADVVGLVNDASGSEETLGAVTGAVERPLTSTLQLTEAAVETLDPLLDAVAGTLEPAVKVVAGTVETISSEIEPLLTPVTDAIAPVSEPILGVVEEALEPPVAPVLEMPMLPILAASVPATSAGSIALGDSSEMTIDQPDGALMTRPDFENPAYTGPAMSPNQATQPALEQRQDLAGVQRENVDESRKPAGSASGPSAWITAWLEMAGRGSLSSVATVSAILTGLIGLFIAPAIAAWVFVAVRMPRSPYYLPVHPPD